MVSLLAKRFSTFYKFVLTEGEFFLECTHIYGGMAERFNATVLKTVVAQVTLSSNLSPYAMKILVNSSFLLGFFIIVCKIGQSSIILVLFSRLLSMSSALIGFIGRGLIVLNVAVDYEGRCFDILCVSTRLVVLEDR